MQTSLYSESDCTYDIQAYMLFLLLTYAKATRHTLSSGMQQKRTPSNFKCEQVDAGIACITRCSTGPSSRPLAMYILEAHVALQGGLPYMRLRDYGNE